MFDNQDEITLSHLPVVFIPPIRNTSSKYEEEYCRKMMVRFIWFDTLLLSGVDVVVSSPLSTVVLFSNLTGSGVEIWLVSKEALKTIVVRILER